MVSFTKLCSLGKSGCEKFKESCFLPSLNSSSQVEPIPNRSTGSSPARLGEASLSEGRSVHRMLTPDFLANWSNERVKERSLADDIKENTMVYLPREAEK